MSRWRRKEHSSCSSKRILEKRKNIFKEYLGKLPSIRWVWPWLCRQDSGQFGKKCSELLAVHCCSLLLTLVQSCEQLQRRPLCPGGWCRAEVEAALGAVLCLGWVLYMPERNVNKAVVRTDQLILERWVVRRYELIELHSQKNSTSVCTWKWKLPPRSCVLADCGRYKQQQFAAFVPSAIFSFTVHQSETLSWLIPWRVGEANLGPWNLLAEQQQV